MRVFDHSVSSGGRLRAPWPTAGPSFRNPLFSDELTITWQKEGAKLTIFGWLAAAVALAAIAAGRLSQGSGVIAAACVQAIASGAVLWAGLAGRRWVGVVVGAALLAGVLAGASVSVWAAREAPAGLAYAMLYAALATWFGRSLRPGREAVVTGIARRLNPRFRPGMIGYTRGVTAIWCGFALAQETASVLLLSTGSWSAWALLVNGGHAVLAAGLALAEFAVRRWRFPGEHTGFWATVRGVRSGRAQPGEAAKRSITS